MRVAVCDNDTFLLEMVESIIASSGHELVGVATDIAAAMGLLEAARPEVAVIDIAMMVNADFDLVAIGTEAGARVIVFSQQADVDELRHYPTPPEVVFKPDLRELEGLFHRLADVVPADPGQEDRRHRPTRAAEGPVPTSIGDAQAFFEAVNNARPGDALLALDVPVGAEAAANDVLHRLRDTDRVLLNLPSAVRCYLPAGGDEAVHSVLARVAAVSSVGDDCTVSSVIVGDGESGADAFDRLRREGEPRPLRTGQS